MEALCTVATINKVNGMASGALMPLLAPATSMVTLKCGSGMDRGLCVTVKQEICGQASGSKTS